MSDTSRRKFLAATGAGAVAGTVAVDRLRRGGHACRPAAPRRRWSPTWPTTVSPSSGSSSASARSSSRTATSSPGSSTQREASEMSSHREAPEIAKDPVADGTDTYAFVSPDDARHGHADRQLHPAPAAERRPELLRVRRRRALRDPHRQPGQGRVGHHLPVQVQDPGPQQGDVPLQHRTDHHDRRPDVEPSAVLHASPGSRTGARRSSREDLPCPPVNVGMRSTPELRRALRSRPCTTSPGSRRVFAGQRADAFHVDLGSIFDLGALRPFNEAHLISMPNMNGVNAVQSYNVHTIALQVPIRRADPRRQPAVATRWTAAP